MNSQILLLVVLGLSACVTGRDIQNRCQSKDGLCPIDLETISEISSASQIQHIPAISEEVELELLKLVTSDDFGSKLESRFLDSVVRIHSNQTGTVNGEAYTANGFMNYVVDTAAKKGEVTATNVIEFAKTTNGTQYAFSNTKGKFEVKNGTFYYGYISWESYWATQNESLVKLGNETFCMFALVNQTGNGVYEVKGRHYGIENNTKDITHWQDQVNGTLYADKNGGNWTSIANGNSTFPMKMLQDSAQGTLNFTSSGSGSYVNKGNSRTYQYTGEEVTAMPGQNFTVTIKGSGGYYLEAPFILSLSKDQADVQNSYGTDIMNILNIIV